MPHEILHKQDLTQFGQLAGFGQLQPPPPVGTGTVLRPGAENLLDNNNDGGGFIQSLKNFAFGKKGEGDKEGTRGPSGLGTTIDAISGLSQLYFGLKSFGLAKDQFKESKRQFNLNFGAQAQTINTRLEDRQRNRVRGNPGAFESVSTFLDKNRIQTGTGG